MSKHVGEPYDPALRQTEYGSKLYQTWRKVRKDSHCEEWEYFPTFYAWAIQSGYTLGAWLRRIDKSKPYEEGNCTWYISGENENYVSPEWVGTWNKTVNRIRKYCGMPPLEGTDYGDL